MLKISKQRRVAFSLSKLFLGLERGHSDPCSGLVSNPMLGLITDWIVGEGG
jgi:altronate dehydratase large subunit